MLREASASPALNWNERIYNECYLPNTEAEIKIGGSIEKVNNFNYISFNIGPTLSGWMIRNHIETYRKIRQAATKTTNAIALPYNHTILPLDREENLKTQIAWGITEYRMRFGKEPAAMWLPECAVSSRVIRELIENGIKYLILASGQARAVRDIGESKWEDVSDGTIDVRRPYRVFEKNGYIDVLFSCKELAGDISFNRMLDKPSELADKMEKIMGENGLPEVVLPVATDGETFGHHHKGAEKGLAYLLKSELPSRGIRVCSIQDYFKEAQVKRQVMLKDNSSWSCSHGIERWRSACGCGAREGGSDLEWRKPLRDAVGMLGEKAIELFNERASGYFTVSPWDAVREFGAVLVNNSKREEFHEKCASDSMKGSIEIDMLMEFIYFTFYSFTSCGWFFDSLDRPEPAQVLSFALKSMELAKDMWGVDLESDFFSILSKYPGAEKVWANVKSRRFDPEDLARDMLEIYSLTGIRKSLKGFWYMKVIHHDSEIMVEMKNRRTNEKIEILQEEL